MMRRLYQWLILIHPPQFRRRFGDEIVCIFDEAGGRAAWTLLADALISLLRQWALRSEFPIILAALLGAALQMTLSGFVWLGATHWTIANAFVRETETQAPREAGVFLLLLAGVIVAFVFGGTVLAVWCIRFCAHRTGRATVRALLITLAVAICHWTGPLAQAQSAAARPEFEVASVKLNTSGCESGRGGGRGGAPAPGRLSVKCITLRDLIQAAYGTFANGPNPDPRLLQLVGSPGWVETDTYDIEAKPAGSATIDQIYGPMLQRLLEDRFQLKIHRETRELPVYVLTIAKTGLKLQAPREGSCTLIDLNHPPEQPVRGQPPTVFCGRTSFKSRGRRMNVDALGVGMASFAGTTLSSRLDLDRPVIDKTGLEGIYDIHLEFSADDRASGRGISESADSDPSLFTALQEQLGLKLSPDKGPVEVLVVDHIERPSGN